MRLLVHRSGAAFVARPKRLIRGRATTSTQSWPRSMGDRDQLQLLRFHSVSPFVQQPPSPRSLTTFPASATDATGAPVVAEQNNDGRMQISVKDEKHNNEIQDYEAFVSNLESKSQQALLEIKELSTKAAFMQLSTLLWNWSRIWNQNNETLEKNHTRRGAEATEKILKALLDVKEKNENESRPIPISVLKVTGGLRTDLNALANITITALARSDIADRGSRAQALFDRMEFLCEKSGGLSEMVFNSTITAHAKSNEDNAIEQCISLLERMDKSDHVKRSIRAYNVVLDAYARRGDAHNAQRLLDKMERSWADSGNDDLMPDVFSYSSVLNAWEKSDKRDAGKRGEDIIVRLVDIYTQTRDQRVFMNEVVFGTCISLYARNPHLRDGAANAERMLDWLIQLYRENDYDERLKPVATHFVTAMNGYAKSRRNDNAVRAENVLKKLEAIYKETGSRDLKPNQQCFVICISAWARSRHRDSAGNAERLLNRMEDLFLYTDNISERMNNFPYNIVTDYLARSGEKGSSKRIEQIINRMTQLAQDTNNDEIAPDRLTHTSLLKAIAKERIPGYHEQCAAVLDKMEIMADNGNESMRPDSIAYSTLVHAYSQEGMVAKAESAIQLLRERGNQPTTFTYNMLLNAIAKSNDQNAAGKAEDILKQMQREWANGNSDCKPSYITYVTCLNVLSKSRDVDRLDRAMSLYNEVIQMSKSGDIDFEPDLSIYGSLLSVISRTETPDKVALALDVLTHISEHGLTPNRVIYNIILNTCAYSHFGTNRNDDNRTRDEILKVAVSTFQILESDKELGGADCNSYKALIHVAGNLIKDEAERLASIEDLFRKCCQAGQLNQWVLQSLFKEAQGPDFWRIVQKERKHGIIKVQDLPSEWSRNIKPGKYRDGITRRRRY